MQKTKFALVSLLSLLVVLAPVSSALAETEGASEPLKQEAQKEQEQLQSSVFEEIEAQGGDEVSEERLGEAEGEFAWWAFSAAAGALITYSIRNSNSWDASEAVREAGWAVATAAVMTFTGGFLGF